MRYRLRTLLVVLALGPPLVAAGYHSYKEVEAEEAAISSAIIFSGEYDLLPWYPPGTPQTAALCRQSAERRIGEK
jgi:hypothetical protein